MIGWAVLHPSDTAHPWPLTFAATGPEAQAAFEALALKRHGYRPWASWQVLGYVLRRVRVDVLEGLE